MAENKFNFSKAISEIEEINDWFQSGDIDLEQGLDKFRWGLKLIKKCRERLKEVENEFIEIEKEFEVEEGEPEESEEGSEENKIPF